MDHQVADAGSWDPSASDAAQWFDPIHPSSEGALHQQMGEQPVAWVQRPRRSLMEAAEATEACHQHQEKKSQVQTGAEDDGH